jgi:hypothetical protein
MDALDQHGWWDVLLESLAAIVRNWYPKSSKRKANQIEEKAIPEDWPAITTARALWESFPCLDSKKFLKSWWETSSIPDKLANHRLM